MSRTVTSFSDHVYVCFPSGGCLSIKSLWDRPVVIDQVYVSTWFPCFEIVPVNGKLQKYNNVTISGMYETVECDTTTVFMYHIF